MNVLPDLIKTNIEDQSLMCHSKQKIFWRQYNIKTKERQHSENRKKIWLRYNTNSTQQKSYINKMKSTDLYLPPFKQDWLNYAFIGRFRHDFLRQYKIHQINTCTMLLSQSLMVYERLRLRLISVFTYIVVSEFKILIGENQSFCDNGKPYF